MSVLVTFIGGPLDGEQQVMQDVSTTGVLHMYHDHGTFRSGTMGRNVYADYVFDHSDPYQPSVYGRGPYGAGPYGRPKYSAKHYFTYVDNSRGDIPEGPGSGIQAGQTGTPPTSSPTLTAVSPTTAASPPTGPADQPVITLTGTRLGDVQGVSLVNGTDYSTRPNSTTDTEVQFYLGIGLAAGDYQVSVISPGGVSNSLPFTVTVSPVPVLTSVAAGDTGGPSLAPGAPNWYSSHELLINGQNLDGAATGDEYMANTYVSYQMPSDNATVKMPVGGASSIQLTTVLPQIVHPATTSMTVTDPNGTSNALPVAIVEQPSGDPGISHWTAIENCAIIQSSTPLGGSNWYPYIITTTAAAPQAIVGFIVPVPGVITAPVSGEDTLLLAFVGHDDNTPVRWVNPEIEWWAGSPTGGGTFIGNASYYQKSYEPPESVSNNIWTSMGAWGICPDHVAHGVPYITARLTFSIMDVTPGEVHYLYGISFGPRW